MKTYRVYFNCRQEHPYIWSYDEGVGTEEHKVRDVIFTNAEARTQFDPTKHPPKDASAWFLVTSAIVEVVDGVANFRGLDLVV